MSNTKTVTKVENKNTTAKDKIEKRSAEELFGKPTSCYGLALDLLCKNPLMTKKELIIELEKSGFSKSSAANTAFSTVRSVYKKLYANGHIK